MRSAVGFVVGYFQRIELVDGDGSSRFEKLAVDFDEGRISWLALCIMIIRLANQKTTVAHRSWYQLIQLCVVPFLSCFFPHRVLHFRANRTPGTAAGRWRRAWDHSSRGRRHDWQVPTSRPPLDRSHKRKRPESRRAPIFTPAGAISTTESRRRVSN